MKALIFDNETTGLIENHLLPSDMQPEIIEYCGILLDLDTKQESMFSTLIKPKKPITEVITKITGINDEMVSEAPSFVDVWPKIAAQFKEADIIVAHNLSFDREMLQIELERIGYVDMPWRFKRLFCTVEQAMTLKGRRMKLSELHQLLFGEPFAGAHRAEADVRATMRCFLKLWEEMEQE